MKKRFQTLFIAITMSVTGCTIYNPNYIDVYNHQYDDLEVSSITPKYSKYTYKDYDKNSFYGELGYPVSYSPSVGDVNFIVVPVWFTDSTDCIAKTSRSKVREDIEKAYFGISDDTGWESVSSYYYKDSFEKLNLSGIVTDWYECGYPSSSFYTNSYATSQLVINAYNWILSKNVIEDITKYDSDHDGFLDGLVLVYGYHDYSVIGRTSSSHKNAGNLWAYTSWIMNSKYKNVEQPGPSSFFWSSYDFMYDDGKYTQSRTGKSSYGTGDNTIMTIDPHTFIHETGHMFGLPDYYDYSGEHSYSLGFSMQDYNVGAHDPYSRFSLGWASAIVPTETTKINLPLMEESGTFVLLSPEYHDSAFDEYLALELYSPTGLNEFDSENQYLQHYPAGPQKVGVRLWHVDSRIISVKKYNMFTGSINRYELTTNPNDGKVEAATSNTTYVEGKDERPAYDYAGSYDYKQLKVIRNSYKLLDIYGDYIDTEERPEVLLQDDLFLEGDYFSLHNYREQFVEGNYLNSLEELGWDFYIDKITDKNATITLIKK